ncbi:xanthine dehydrogenase molybdopterin binding subunit [Arenibaculum pallidiluteum]|uniref:xanthine dehydrogenase molybdopterin binding subunit n=1 Tax=Arenibaculum pallidiluteum TaxID=2812559 RepID=UPI001A969EDF|nr:xanthine dehydrogenase molybdopterin binding subunit [Arenibaculum pallidiluteum]
MRDEPGFGPTTPGPVHDANPGPARLRGAAGDPVPHDSAAKHVSGEAVYTDDIPELPGTLHAYVLQSPRAHARILRLDVSAARRAPGVHAVLTAGDVPGAVDIGPVFPGDPVLAPELVEYVGQAVAAIAAETPGQARAAAALIEAEYEDLPAILTVDEALEAGSYVGPGLTMRLGESAAALAAAPRRLSGSFAMGGQDHFYLEGQIAYALPREDGDMLVHSSTQHPSEVQHLIAKVLGRPDAHVTVEVRRMGGGFGGKETQPALIACIAALLADATGRPVKYRMDRDDDMVMTGKRHDFQVRYEVGFDEEGRIQGIEMDLAARCGMSPDLSNAVVDRAMFHADNAYFLANATVTGLRCKTNTVSNTAFRGFGGPQGMVAIEYVVDEIARALGRDPLDVRRANLYGPGRDLTHYHQPVEDGPLLAALMDDLEASCAYRERRRAIDAFNAAHRVLKKGLALTPVKFGISFTATHMNQAGALVHLYQDGSIQLNHGGTEMGQGVHTKVAQLVATEFGVGLDRVRIMATSTGKVPNTSPTAASSGTDLNGAAALRAAREIRNRMTLFLAEHFAEPAESVAFRDGIVAVGGRTLAFAEACHLAYVNRIHLSAAGYYRTPKIWWDRTEARGRPFYYFACGAAATEVLVDTLTGEYRFLRADLLHDCGTSVNPAIDLGQVEGGYVQGLGWLSFEELWWDAHGRLRTHAPSTYKIPTGRDVPADFRVRLVANQPNREDVVHRSKAVGEPPLMLAISGYLALKDAVAAVGGHRFPVHLDAPATPERVLMACEAVRALGAAGPWAGP